MRRPPNPVAGAAAERCPVVADDPADVILNGPAAGNLVVTGKGVRFRPWGVPADGVATAGATGPESHRARNTAHTGIPGVPGPVGRNPRP